jgi:hypothetical protein
VHSLLHARLAGIETIRRPLRVARGCPLRGQS